MKKLANAAKVSEDEAKLCNMVDEASNLANLPSNSKE